MDDADKGLESCAEPLYYPVRRQDAATLTNSVYTKFRTPSKNSFIYQLLMGIIKQAVGVAIKKVRWNYKTAVPVYYPKTNKVNLLLPLSLLSNDKIDLALVVEKEKEAHNDTPAYMGHTIYPLDWAYSNARLIARPESSWLQE